jgi:hypothetical protein
VFAQSSDLGWFVDFLILLLIVAAIVRTSQDVRKIRKVLESMGITPPSQPIQPEASQVQQQIEPGQPQAPVTTQPPAAGANDPYYERAVSIFRRRHVSCNCGAQSGEHSAICTATRGWEAAYKQAVEEVRQEQAGAARR